MLYHIKAVLEIQVEAKKVPWNHKFRSVNNQNLKVIKNNYWDKEGL
jgi:hypothetical protein